MRVLVDQRDLLETMETQERPGRMEKTASQDQKDLRERMVLQDQRVIDQ